MRTKWEEDESGWHKLPPRAWPSYQPKAEEQERLRSEVHDKCSPRGPDCRQAMFDLASCLVFGGLKRRVL